MSVKVTNNIGKVTLKIKDRASSSVAKIAIRGAARSDERAPIEFGDLLDSRFIRFEDSPSAVRAVVGYTVDYSYWLNQFENWNPRPPELKAGNQWNPNAKPHFLDYYGFESPDARADINRILAQEMKI